ncbi:helix-turn-helix transcriptional regulator [Afipia massiliensis]|uniref:Helix-turn-helix transcriptional regulator n=1 Tax=Afipia massiliensis TaxID=211460 RepID=A0A4U6BQH1_9BRAD|nr:helix-turn-helix domain-containing protein [Afipia massiliensis]TKT72727.1 helix-turn-helix transcriptional regulator [Afipia massiliensis]
MKRQDFGCAPGCSVEVTLDLIDGKWKGVILYHLQEGRLRFGELRKRLPNVTQRMLTKQLRALEEDDLIIRKVYAEVPPRVDYELSETGQRLRPVIDALKQWGDENRARIDAASAGKKGNAQSAATRPSRQPQPA